MIRSARVTAQSSHYVNPQYFRAFNTLPIISLEAFTKPSINNNRDKVGSSTTIISPEQKLVAQKLHNACSNVGFCILTNHGVSESLLRDFRSLGHQFFFPPNDRKDHKESIALSNSTGFRGYQVLGQNITLGKPDFHEGLDFFRDYTSEESNAITKSYPQDAVFTQKKNLWPQYPAEFQSCATEYVSQMLNLGSIVMHAIAIGLSSPNPLVFEKSVSHSHWNLRSIGYPPSNNSNSFGVGAHTDYGCLTFVNQDEIQETLQVQNSTGEWIFVEPMEGAIVMNIGDMLSIWSNGLYSATSHRVLSPNSVARVSTPFFFEPNLDAVIAPLEHLGTPEKKPVRYGDHLYSKLSTNFV